MQSSFSKHLLNFSKGFWPKLRNFIRSSCSYCTNSLASELILAAFQTVKGSYRKIQGLRMAASSALYVAEVSARLPIFFLLFFIIKVMFSSVIIIRCWIKSEACLHSFFRWIVPSVETSMIGFQNLFFVQPWYFRSCILHSWSVCK